VLPKGIEPILVLDASARVRSTYAQWQEKRGGIVQLRPAPKRYDNLTVHVWDRSGSKGAFRMKGAELVEGIAETINSKPEGEGWLVIGHKADPINMELERHGPRQANQ